MVSFSRRNAARYLPRAGMQHQLVGHEVVHRVSRKSMNSLPELNDHMSIASRKALSSSEIKRHICPAPVVDHQLHGDEGLCLGIGRHFVFVSISRRTRACHCAFAILSADSSLQHFFRAHGLNGMKNLCLLISHSIGAE